MKPTCRELLGDICTPSVAVALGRRVENVLAQCEISKNECDGEEWLAKLILRLLDGEDA